MPSFAFSFSSSSSSSACTSSSSCSCSSSFRARVRMRSRHWWPAGWIQLPSKGIMSLLQPACVGRRGGRPPRTPLPAAAPAKATGSSCGRQAAWAARRQSTSRWGGHWGGGGRCVCGGGRCVCVGGGMVGGRGPVEANALGANAGTALINPHHRGHRHRPG